jgi:hypothetical protein
MTDGDSRKTEVEQQEGIHPVAGFACSGEEHSNPSMNICWRQAS